jgi:hypothetical protein
LRFAGSLFYETEDGERHRLAEFEVEAADAAAAEKLVLDEFWDRRLESASCAPVFKYAASPDAGGESEA